MEINMNNYIMKNNSSVHG